MTYIAESTAMMVKSLIYRNETPFMKRQAQQCAGLTERMSLVVKTQCKLGYKISETKFPFSQILDLFAKICRYGDDSIRGIVFYFRYVLKKSQENLENDLEKMTVISSQEIPSEQKINDDSIEQSMSEDEAIDVD